MNLMGYLVPALREVRGPLLGGYAWLLALWLHVGDRVPDPSQIERGSPWAALGRLQDALGEGGLLVAISTVAYLVGSLASEAVTSVMRLVDVDGRRFERMAEASPELRALADAAARNAFEAELRLQVAVPVLVIAAAFRGEGVGVVLAVALAGVVLAVHGAVLTNRAFVQGLVVHDEFRRRRAEQSDEERKAREADVRVRQRLDGTHRLVVIENKGAGRAEMIDVTSEEGGRLHFLPSIFPIEELPPGETIELPVTPYPQRGEVRVVVTWIDRTGPRRRLQVLPLL